MRFGYVRISTDDQNLDRQRIALGYEECGEVIEETQSGVKARHRLDALIGRLAAGDKLIVTEIDRLGRSTGEVIMLMDELTKRGVRLRILAMPALDIRSDDVRLITDIMASFAAHERRRTQATAGAGYRRRQGRRPASWPTAQAQRPADRRGARQDRGRRAGPTCRARLWRGCEDAAGNVEEIAPGNATPVRHPNMF